MNNKYDYINFPKSFYNTVNINNNFNLEKLKIFNNGITAKVRIIVVDGDSYITQEEINTLSVIDGVIQDTYDPSREGTRAVYGYFKKTA